MGRNIFLEMGMGVVFISGLFFYPMETFLNLFLSPSQIPIFKVRILTV